MDGNGRQCLIAILGKMVKKRKKGKVASEFSAVGCNIGTSGRAVASDMTGAVWGCHNPTMGAVCGERCRAIASALECGSG